MSLFAVAEHGVKISPPMKTTSLIGFGNRLDHFQARIGWRREGHRVAPGLYELGAPGKESPVFVTANYTLSFDALRSSLSGMDAYILVLDTKGINVWCAAGKGTFGTEELVHRVKAAGLKALVNHRKLILPQLGAVGVAAHVAKKNCGFKVEYGPVRAKDIKDYLENGAAPEMRRVNFGLIDRLTLIPVEFKHFFIPMVIASAVMFALAGTTGVLAALTAFTGGLALFPALLPHLPFKNFSLKGFVLGVALALPFTVMALMNETDALTGAGWALGYLLAMPPVTAYLALNFTGSTTFTSVTGVKKEISIYTPILAKLAGAGTVMMAILAVSRYL
ncbi:MAG: carbon monoxide dehydrogenase [Nitrospinae bacterium]|nr:carbon monoxide dehydrogenase [Nitrospinota bacterium]